MWVLSTGGMKTLQLPLSRLQTRGIVHQRSKSGFQIWHFISTKKSKNDSQTSVFLFIYFPKIKGNGPTRKCAHLRNVLSVTVRNKIFLSTLVKERKCPSLRYLFIYLFLKYMKIARQGSYTFKILNFQTFFSVISWLCSSHLFSLEDAVSSIMMSNFFV